MKLTMAITLDGLVRAMRWKAHDLAEEVERRPLAGSRITRRQAPDSRKRVEALSRGERDDLGRR